MWTLWPKALFSILKEHLNKLSSEFYEELKVWENYSSMVRLQIIPLK